MSYEKTIIIETTYNDGSPEIPALAFLRLDTANLKHLHQSFAAPSSQQPNFAILLFQWWPYDSEYEIQGVKVSANTSGALTFSPNSDEITMRTIAVPKEVLHAIRISSVTHTHHIIGSSDLFREQVAKKLGSANFHFHTAVWDGATPQKREIAAERIFNLYIYAENDVIRELGATVRESNGSPEDKLSVLQRFNKEDMVKARRFPVPSRYTLRAAGGTAQTGALTHDQFNDLAAAGQLLNVFDEVLIALDSPRPPLYCVSPVINGALPAMSTIVRTPAVE